MRRALLIAVLCSCGGSSTPTSQNPEPDPHPVAAALVVPPPQPQPVPEPAPPPPPPDRVPEVFAPAWKTVGVGQTISFSVAAIDQDLDETRVLVTRMPASARFDALTQTVTWTPTKADRPAGQFVLEVANLDPAGAPTQTWNHTWEIAVARKKQPPPVAARQSALVETLLTIREPARLVAVNKEWAFDRFLLRGAELQRATLPPEQQARLGRLDRKALFASFLASLAEAHGNPRLDPRSKHFDREVFGDPKAWRIVAVRPRVDKRWTELRVVYQAVEAPEPVFAMFRVRPTWDSPTLPTEARAYNNKVFLGMVARHLLDDGAASEAHLARPKVHGKAVAALVRELLAYDDSTSNPWARAALLAVPTEARLGGGARRDEDGGYRSGDGWAWTVMKPLPTADGKTQRYVNIAIPGFWTHTVPSPDGTAWTGACAPKFDPDDPAHAPGYEVLCRKALGFVDLPAVVGGKVTSATIDAVNLFVDHKEGDAVALLPLDDGRRDHGEENGMTCAQCHIRNFTVRDHRDAATGDPRQGTPTRPSSPIATLDFQIIPTTGWAAYTLDFMKDQECKAARQIEQFLGKPSRLGCPLAP